MSITLFVPPGIGDFSAMYSKLSRIKRDMVIRPSVDSPNRMSPYLDILPKIWNGGYAGHTADFVIGYTLPPGTDIMSLEENGEYFLAINAWLEQGGKVADWIPGETDYHYEMAIPEPMKAQINPLLQTTHDVPRVGVYCSAYGNARHWNFWTFPEWKQFLDLVRKVLPPDTMYFFIGAEYDVDIANLLAEDVQASGGNAINVLGKFHIGGTTHLISHLDYFFVFPSGLGFLADVVNTPHMMWFPNHLGKMRNTFTDPVNQESGRSKHLLFSQPELAFVEFKKDCLHFVSERLEARRCARI